MFIDAHAHLDPDYFETTPEALIQEASDAGVHQLVVVGCGVESSRRAIELARRHPRRLFAAVGIHPHDVEAMRPEDFEAIARLAREEEVVAVGETGLDYHYRHSPPEAQRAAFRRFIELANEVDKPVVVHSREAEEETLEILRQVPPRAGAQIHCFTGSSGFAEQCVAEGFHISFSGVLTFNNADPLREVAQRLPLDRILVETDCPYLTPAPFRGRKNTPAFVTVTAGRLAAERGLPVEEVARATSENARRLFRLPPPPPADVLAFAVGTELWVAVHGHDAESVVSAARRWPLKKVKVVRAWAPPGTSAHAATAGAVRTWAEQAGKIFRDT